MNDIAIRVENLGKRYRIGKRERYKTLRDTLTDTMCAPFRRIQSAFRGSGSQNSEGVNETIWALKNVSFEIPRGEVVGVIGRNGAGKSTLLKLLSRITEPTEGHAEIHGRVGSLLEVGTGFHPELTGRENIYLNGAILGMRRAEIASKFDEIVAFAEIDKFIDTPVKHYSSGMYMRLAFAVAAHLEPEILIVDEVLAVGDAAFQKKCLGKMGEVAKQGRTVLFVSHNLSAISALCTRAALLDRGRLIHVHAAADVVRQYLSEGFRSVAERSWPELLKAPGDESVRIQAVRVIDRHANVLQRVDITERTTVEVEYSLMKESAPINVSISLHSEDDVYVLASPSICGGPSAVPVTEPGRYRSRCTIPANLLNEGCYAVSVFLVSDANHVLAHVDRTIAFDTYDLGQTRANYFGYWGGVVRPLLPWETIRLGSLLAVTDKGIRQATARI
jgi:lipopolysaccharide transport system ATP-binding protein